MAPDGLRTTVLVIGGGFAGLQLIRHLDEMLFDVLLIDKLNHHQFQPLLYQVAASQLEPSSITFPFRKIFQRRKNMQIRMAEVQRIETSVNIVITDIGDFHYDKLVIATGCKTGYFGNHEIMKHALPLKSTYDAITIRNHVLKNFERLISADDKEKEGFLNMVIAGAGPTGVEMAGAFAELKKEILPKDYPGIDLSKLTIYLIEGSPYTLNSMSDQARKASRKYLDDMGVKVITEVFVSNYDGNKVSLNNGEVIVTQNLIWAAGVTGNFIDGLGEGVMQHGQRIKVDRFNKVQGHENIYAIGDIAFMETPNYPRGHPQLANVAINQAKNLAKNMKAQFSRKPLTPFEYRDLGSMATIGKHRAVVDLPFIKFKGYLAWLVWMFLHLMLILSVRNKLIVFINWAWHYVTGDTSLRLILSPPAKKNNIQSG